MGWQAILSSAAAVATIASLFFAVWQYRRRDQVITAEAGRITSQRQRLRNAQASVVWARDATDAIVQRSKQKGVTLAELGHEARAVRAQLRLLVDQLAEEDKTLQKWQDEGLVFKSNTGKEVQPTTIVGG